MVAGRLDPKLVTEWEKVRDDGREFIRRLYIEDYQNRRRRLDPLWDEQVHWVDALFTSNWVFGLKPRQVGFTTVTAAFLFWKVLTSGKARRVLQMVHEQSAMRRIAHMMRFFHRNLPPEIRPKLSPNSVLETVFSHNDGGFARLLAGGTGQARSWTYTDLHATEMSKWRRRTAANTNEEGNSTDEETFASAMNTIHDPTASVIVESTASGPYGLHYRLYRQALKGAPWKFVFVPWNVCRRYRIEGLSEQERGELLDSLTTREERLMQPPFCLDVEQLAWRRQKILSLGSSELTFRRDFPLTHDEPWKLDEKGWFDQQILSDMLGWIEDNLDAGRPRVAGEPTFYQPFEPGRRYVLGGDTSGGVGADEAACHILRDDMVHCATWASNTTHPLEQAVQFVRMADMYSERGNRCLVAIEANKDGLQVIERAEALGANTYRDYTTNPKGSHFWSTGGTAGDMGRRAYSHARQVVDGEWAVVQDPETVRQLQKIVEKPNGKIEATGDEHDDRADAWVLALWAGRDIWRRQRDDVEREKDRIGTILQRFSPENGR